MKPNVLRRPLPRRQSGMSLVEVMVAVTLGLIIMAGLASLFASNSAARNEIERSSRQIENGRFAMELIINDLRLAGFFGEAVLPAQGGGLGQPDICSGDPVEWKKIIYAPVYVYDNGAGVPSCITAGASIKPGTDVIVVRRASTCEAGVGDCPVMLPNKPYIQVSRCDTDNLADKPMIIATGGTGTWTNKMKDCATRANLRLLITRVYFISPDNGSGVAVPTLKRADFTGTAFEVTNLVEGIEELNIEFGIDYLDRGGNGADPARQLDGQPDAFVADPATATLTGCTPNCDPANNWNNIVSARVHLLARNLEASPNYKDTKTYTLGRDAGGFEIQVTPNDAYRRHAYSGVARMINIGQRRERPI